MRIKEDERILQLAEEIKDEERILQLAEEIKLIMELTVQKLRTDEKTSESKEEAEKEMMDLWMMGEEDDEEVNAETDFNARKSTDSLDYSIERVKHLRRDSEHLFMMES